MPKLHVQPSSTINGQPATGTDYWFHCPGCRCAHRFSVRTDGGRPNWSFDGNLEKPTFSPSLLYTGRCHLFMRAGRIEFLGDCNHALAGQTVDIPDWDC